MSILSVLIVTPGEETIFSFQSGKSNQFDTNRRNRCRTCMRTEDRQRPRTVTNPRRELIADSQRQYLPCVHSIAQRRVQLLDVRNRQFKALKSTSQNFKPGLASIAIAIRGASVTSCSKLCSDALGPDAGLSKCNELMICRRQR